jgi:di- and tripeptidase/Cys-Gly metallodipeptidase DUG1
MPVASTLEKLLKAPALLLPMGQSSDNCHLSNEKIRRLNILRGKDVIKNFLITMQDFSK